MTQRDASSRPGRSNGDASNGSASNGRSREFSLALPIVSLPSAHPCHDCGRCCTYVAVEIDNPTSFRDYDNLYWYLTHQGICVYVDWEGDWFIEFETRCEHLTDTKSCGIYAERPKLCSEFSWDECEVASGESAWKYRFDTYPELLEWMREKRPAAYQRYQRQRRTMLQKRSAPERRVIRRKRAAEATA